MIFISPEIGTSSVAILGERLEQAEIVVLPYPSDHQTVVAEINILQRTIR